MIFWCDFETASECDLPEAGVYNYARHPSTRVLCMSYAFNDGPVMTWRPGEPMPDVRGQIRAHNAAFERLIFWHVLGMDIPLEQFYCTAAQTRANCAPGSLEDVGRFAGLSMRKDHRGAYLVRKCCMPPFNTELLPELIEYCEQDVRTMRAASVTKRSVSRPSARRTPSGSRRKCLSGRKANRGASSPCAAGRDGKMTDYSGLIEDLLVNGLGYGFQVADLTQRAAKALEAQAKEIAELRVLLKDCADDLEAEVDARYGETLKKCMPHRYERDMAPVIAARAALKGEKIEN